jgi:hypothetical protein
MPVIPGMNNRSRMNLGVPQVQAAPASTLGDAFANVGGQAAQFGLEIMQFRKKAADARDVSEKSLQLQSELLNVTTELENARMNDGSLNPDVFGYKDKEANTRFSYTEKLGEFWDERLKTYAKTAASPESREDFLGRARGLKTESMLKGEAKTLELEVASTLNVFFEGAKAVTNSILVVPELTVPEAAKNAGSVWNDHTSLFSKGLINEPTYRAQDKKVTREMTVASLDNFVRNSRPDEIEALIFSGNLPKEYDEVLEQAAMIQEMGGMAEIRKQWAGIVSPERLQAMEEDFKRMMKIDPKNRLKYRGDVDAERLAQSLTNSDIEKYLREAQKLRRSNALNGATTAVKEHQALNRRLMEDRGDRPISVDEMRQVTDRTAAVVASTDNFDTKFEYSTRLLETLLNKRIGEVQRESLVWTEDEHAGYVNEMISEPLKNVQMASESIKELLPEIEDPTARQGYIEQQELLEKMGKGEYSQQVSEFTEQTVAKLSEIRNKNRAQLLSDPASLFQSEPLGPSRLNRMDESFNAYNIPPHRRKYASKAEIEDFKIAFDKAPTDESRVNIITGLRERWGGLDNWYKVMNQYVDESGLPKAIKIAGLMPDRTSMQSFLGVMAPGRGDEIRKNFKNAHPDQDASVFYESVQENPAFADLNLALAGMVDSSLESVETINSFRDSIALYTMHTFNEKGGSFFGPNAVDASSKLAATEIISKNFTVASNGSSSVFAPVAPVVQGPMRDANVFYPKKEELNRFLEVYSDPVEMAKLADKMPMSVIELANTLTAVEGRDHKKLWQDTLQNYGYWATSPDMSGLILRMRDGNDLNYSGAIPDKDGNNIIIPWNRLVNDPKVMGGF